MLTVALYFFYHLPPPLFLFPSSSARRLDELQTQARREIYGEVFHIREQDFVKEVSQAPKDTYVVVHLAANTSVVTKDD